MGAMPSNFGFEALTGLQPGLFGPLTVSQLTRMVRDTLRAILPPAVTVTGQVSNFRPAGSGHAWFTLKDEQAQLSCVMWTDKVRRLKFKPEDGLEVVATGSIDVYAAQGRYQLYVERLEPVGVGALELAFRQLYEKLGKEGLFDAARKKPLPAYPGTIAIVTSPTGAAVRDIIQTILRRWPAIRLIVVPVRVQGEKAAEEIAAAIRRVNELRKDLQIDLMIVGRGGGSIEDLWAFNEEVVARAIHASALPVISAVGHERDTTISDLVADVRAATPTAAGELAVPVLNEVVMELHEQASQLARRLLDRLETCRLRLESVCKELWLVDPIGRLRHRRQELHRLDLEARARLQRCLATHAGRLADARLRMQQQHPQMRMTRHRIQLEETAARLERAVAAYGKAKNTQVDALAACFRQLGPLRQIQTLRGRLDSSISCIEAVLRRDLQSAGKQLATLEARVEASNPKSVLKRGFTITRNAATGRIITAAEMVRPGMTVATETAEGEFHSVVHKDGRRTLQPRHKLDKRQDAGQLTLPMEPMGDEPRGTGGS